MFLLPGPSDILYGDARFVRYQLSGRGCMFQRGRNFYRSRSQTCYRVMLPVYSFICGHMTDQSML